MRLTTQRLILREFIEEDWEAVLQYQNDPLYLRYNPFTERSEADDPTRALDQHHPKRRLELAQSGRKRRLGDEAGIRGFAEMAVLAQRHQILELFDGGEMDGHDDRAFQSVLKT